MSRVLCQLCGAANPDEVELCRRCGATLLVVSGPNGDDGELDDELILRAQEELDEHLLERISTLEESVQQLAHALTAAAEHIGQLEHNLTVTHAGVHALGDLLSSQGITSRAEVAQGWKQNVDHDLLYRSLSHRLKGRSERIVSLASHTGRPTDRLRRQLRALELALVAADPDQVRDLLADLLRSAPDNDELWSLAGEISFETGDLESARVAFGRVLELRGPHFETLVQAGSVAADLERWDEAETALLSARELAPESFLPDFALGAVATLRGDPVAAVSHLEACLAREEVAQARYLLGLARIGLDRPGLAIRELRRAVELAPDFEEALYQLGVAYLRRGWSRLALETFEHLLRLDPQRLLYQEAVRLIRLEQPKALPDWVAPIVQGAEEALEEGRTDAALELFEQAAAAAPGQSSLEATIALLASALGRSRLALAHAHRLLVRDEERSPYLAAAVVAALESLRHAGRPRAARAIARRLHGERSDRLARSMAAYELALVESELGEDLDQARDLAREALETAPRELQHYPLAALGLVALRRGRIDEARLHLERAAEAGPHPPLLRELALGRVGAGDAGGIEAHLATAGDETGRGLDEELLGHVIRLGALFDDRNLRHSDRRTARERRRSDPRPVR